ncbi:hypothetical protein [Arthrobacter sp. Br18]|uniref:hypothetical protein n=1 Tax=Arthrobacter sp. Br18 TaxID=1312954 RepID=UPI00047A1B91|nr:hypothetical protein [Arthrobacter sp. Br18]
MKSAPKNRVRQAVAAGALLAVLGVTGCTANNLQATTIQYAASDGIVKDVGSIELRNILVISSEDGEPGRLLGTAINTSDSPVQLTIEAENETAEITIDAEESWVFEDEVDDDGTLAGIAEIPGSLLDLTFSSEEETATFNVPVLDGTLEEYREYVPGGYTPEPREPAATEEESEEES